MLDSPIGPQQHIVLDYHNPYLLSITQKCKLVNLFFEIFEKTYAGRAAARLHLQGPAPLTARLHHHDLGVEGAAPYIKSEMKPYWNVPASFCSTRL